MYALLKSAAPAAERINSLEGLQIDEPALTHSLRRKLLNRHKQNFNWQQGGPVTPVKYLDRDCVEYSIAQAAENNIIEARMAKLTLYLSLALQDKVWGGVCQYSTGNWRQPHYEMTMSSQAGCLRIYALAWALWGNTLFRDAALRIRNYLSRFLLSPVEAFYAGQHDRVPGMAVRDYYALDEAQRLQTGLPEIDTRILSRENGWAIEALASCYELCNDEEALTLATNAARWIVKHRSIADGGFSHDDALSYRLGDTLAMGRAFLQLYRVTGAADWLIRAGNAADFIALHFYHRGGGYVPEINRRVSRQPGPGIDENISLMRFANLLAWYTGYKRHRKMAKHCFRFLCLDEIACARQEETGILLADQEYNATPVQIMILGDTADPAAVQLHRTAMRHPAWYKKIAWNQAGESALLCPEIYYGNVPAAIVRSGFSKTEVFHDAHSLAGFLAKI